MANQRDREYLVVANANAGTAERPAIEAAVAILAGDGPTRLRETGSVDELDQALDGAVDAGHVVVAVGGDGSLHAVVSRLRARGELTDAVLGLIPLGTGNDFARGTDVPLEPAAAAERIVAGHPRAFDLLVDDDDHVVVNAVHVGVGAMAAERAAGLKERFGRAAYPLGALLEAAQVDGLELSVTVDGEPLPLPGERVLVAGIGNGPSVGGGTMLCPGADPCDGLVDVVVACATGPAARVAFANDVRTGRHLERDDVVSVRGTRVGITGEAVVHDADGELSRAVPHRTYRVDPGAWTLLI